MHLIGQMEIKLSLNSGAKIIGTMNKDSAISDNSMEVYTADADDERF